MSDERTPDVATTEPVGLPVAESEAPLAADEKRFKVVAIVAGVLLGLQVLPALIATLSVVPTFKSMYDSMGGTLPAPTAVVVALGPWMAVVVAVVYAAIYWGFYKLAKKYWIGLLFAPLFAVGILTALLAWTLYLPAFDVINLVR